MDKRRFMFWDKAKNKIVEGDENSNVILLGNAESGIDVWLFEKEGYKVSLDLLRYTLLRCAQHAPKLRDESTGDVRQLMEGDVLECSPGCPWVIVFRDDSLVMVDRTGAFIHLKEMAENNSILGNALLTPSLVSDWSDLPEWTLLQERVAEWKAAQVKVNPEIEALKECLAEAKEHLTDSVQATEAARDTIITTEVRLAELEEKGEYK